MKRNHNMFWKIILILFISCCAFVSGNVKDSTKTIKVMCYNIHHGEGVDGVVDLERIAQLILENKIDLVALQEVDVGVARTNRINIMKILSELTGMYPVFEKNIDYQGGEYGNGILSRYPVIESKNHHYKMIREGEQRGLLKVIVDVYGMKIAFMNTHIDYREDDSERINNIKEINNIVKEFGDMPVLIAGDFNDIPGSRTHLTMKENFFDVWEKIGEGDGFTFHTENPDKRIDYFFLYRNNSLKVKLVPESIEVIYSIASDHLPLIAEFVIERK